MSSEPGELELEGPLAQLVVTRLWALLYAFEARLARELAPLGLTVAGFRLVGEVMRSPAGISQGELARRLGVRAPTVSSAVSALEAAGVVVREQDPCDGRAYLVRLATGAPLIHGVELLERLDAELVGELGDDERARLVDLLDRAARHLAGPQPCTDQPP